MKKIQRIHPVDHCAFCRGWGSYQDNGEIPCDCVLAQVHIDTDEVDIVRPK